MSRNGSGVYSLPQPAFVTGTKISSSAMNSDLSDIAAALTQSVSADGQTPLTGPLLMPNGTAGAPGQTFIGDKTTGFYLPNAGQIGWAAAGTQGATFNSDKSVTWAGAASWAGGVTFNGNVTIGAVTTQINATSINFNSTGLASFWTGLAPNTTIEFVIDGGGSTILSGQKGHYEVPFNCTIKRSTLLADQSGSIVVDVWKAAYGSFPPNSGNTITASATPTITSAQKAQDSTLSGWTTSLTAGDILAFNVNSATTITRVTLSLLVLRTGS